MDRPRRKPGGGEVMDALTQKVERSFGHLPKDARMHILDFVRHNGKSCGDCHHTTEAPRLHAELAAYREKEALK